ncbi:F-box/WD repeat-containing protein-like protein lin-23 [Massariosphaeria phaeospora]|uniref:F-box/WD repeat-containing protein-like protein lin-23 n=1 Tax=Massariosphaeria phaeospora TaxID=100035 RepID=A0A7C8IFL8_9PLEO|nr:F-box/WD repeat-containing protein-like protein lin-23 [Massariosphaeria phaeospora]
MNRRPSILSHRPKTSSAVDDDAPPKTFAPSMKRTASQTFSTPSYDCRDAGAPLDSVREGISSSQYPSSHHSHSSSLSRSSQGLVGGVKALCRRMSTSSSSSRRPSAQDIFDRSMLTNASRKASADLHRQPLQHHDSGIPPLQKEMLVPGVHSKFSGFTSLRRGFGSTRRRQATSGPSGEAARASSMIYNSEFPPLPPFQGAPAPGTAARQAAAAANDARQHQIRREQEQTEQFLQGLLPPHVHDRLDMEEVIKDSESGIGMNCLSSPLSRTDSVQEKKMVDPLRILPAELATLVLCNLDVQSLKEAESVSKLWRSAASDPHVWRNVFLRKYEPEVHVSPTPIMMGGAGIGKFNNGKPAPGQDWKTMYRVRSQINRAWETATPRAIYMNGHTDSVYCCQFDEKKIITGSRDRTIRVWDMQTYQCLKVIGGPAVRPVINTPPSLETHKEMVVSQPSLNGTSQGNAIYHVPADYHDASILCLQYDDRIMVTGSSDHTCIVWDITGDEYKPLRRLRGHQAGVLDVCLDDKHIISCSKDSAILVWDRQTGKHIRTLHGHRGPVNAVQLRGNLLVSASGDGMAKLWNLESGVVLKDFPSEDRGLAAVEFSDDTKYVLAGGNDHVVYKFDTTTGKLLHTSTKHGGLVRSLFLDAHNGRIISGSYDQSIRIAHYETGQVFAFYENWTTSWILSAKSDYRRVVATSQDGRALILDFGWGVPGADFLVGTK